MNIKDLVTDDDAVSPVIGVILMVAITVILAAVIGAFVLNIGGSQEAAPQATLDFENTSSGITITMQSGEALDGDNIEIQVSDPTGDDSTVMSSKYSNEMTSGDSITFSNNTGSGVTWGTGGAEFHSGTEVSFVWKSPSSGDTSIIASYETN